MTNFPSTGPVVYKDENGQRHREDGPAFIYTTGRLTWYKHGRRHRLDGPANIPGPVANISGYDQPEYWIEGVQYSDELTYWMAVSEWKKLHG